MRSWEISSAVVGLVEHERLRLQRAQLIEARGEDVVVDERDVRGWLRLAACVARAVAGERLDGALGQPVAQLAQPVELEARWAHDHRGIRRGGLERGERLDRLAEPLLVGEERAPLGEQVADAGALERLELAAEAGDVQLGVGGAGERYETCGACVLLADLLQQLQGVGLDPDGAVGEELIERGHAERVGADGGEL